MDSTSQTCIWCKRPVRKANVEHILPDSLGCPPGFVLRDCVCMACNNGLGHVDQALLCQFETIAFLYGIPRKGGRPPAINSLSAIRGRYGTNGPEVFINAGPQTVQVMGKNLHAASKKGGINNVTINGPRIVGQEYEISWNQDFGSEPKFRRALYKVALGTLAYVFGAAEALRPEYDPLRGFVRKGQGEFDALVMSSGETTGRHSFTGPITPQGCNLPILEIEIFGVSFGVDLDPNQRGMALMVERLKASKAQNWTVLTRSR